MVRDGSASCSARTVVVGLLGLGGEEALVLGEPAAAGGGAGLAGGRPVDHQAVRGDLRPVDRLAALTLLLHPLARLGLGGRRARIDPGGHRVLGQQLPRHLGPQLRGMGVEDRLQLLPRHPAFLIGQRLQPLLHLVETQLILRAQPAGLRRRHRQFGGDRLGVDGLGPRDLGRDAADKRRRLLHVLRPRGSEPEQRSHLLRGEGPEGADQQQDGDEDADGDPRPAAGAARRHAPADPLEAGALLLAAIGHFGRPGMAEAGVPVAAR